MDMIATLTLIELTSDGGRTPVEVQIGRPDRDERGVWTCSILITAAGQKVREIHGEDSMQALCLGTRFVRCVLQSILDRGSRLLDARGEADFPLETYFGSAGP